MDPSLAQLLLKARRLGYETTLVFESYDAQWTLTNKVSKLRLELHPLNPDKDPLHLHRIFAADVFDATLKGVGENILDVTIRDNCLQLMEKLDEIEAGRKKKKQVR